MKQYDKIVKEYNYDMLNHMFWTRVDCLGYISRLKIMLFCAMLHPIDFQVIAFTRKVIKEGQYIEPSDNKYKAEIREMCDSRFSSYPNVFGSCYYLLRLFYVGKNSRNSHSLIVDYAWNKDIPIILTYIEIFINVKQYLIKTKILEDFASQDIDTLPQTDINMILDYIQEEQEVDLTELSVHPRILTEFIRDQINYEKFYT